MKAVRDQRGAIMVPLIAVMLVVLLLVPFLLDFAQVHFVRRRAVAAADAAALAAAVEIRDYLSVQWSPVPRLFCNRPASVVVANYRDIRVNGALGIGRGVAGSYAATNDSSLTGYAPTFDYLSGQVAEGIPIPCVRVRSGVEKSAAPITQYGVHIPNVPADATARVCLQSYRCWQRLCWCTPHYCVFEPVCQFTWESLGLVD